MCAIMRTVNVQCDLNKKKSIYKKNSVHRQSVRSHCIRYQIHITTIHYTVSILGQVTRPVTIYRRMYAILHTFYDIYIRVCSW